MTLDDIPPFARIGAIVLGLAVFGIVLKICSSSGSYAEHTCNALPMDKINACLARAKACSGSKEESHACVDKAAAELGK